jgi:hypothetical protein
LQQQVFGTDQQAGTIPGSGHEANGPAGSATVGGGAVYGSVVGLNQGVVINSAYNRIERLNALHGGDYVAGDKVHGDKVAGDKITIGTLQIVRYIGPAQPPDAAARFALEQAYRSEVALRYALWRSRYAALPMQTAVQPPKQPPERRFFEREDLVFQTLATWLQPAAGTPNDEDEPAAPQIDTFTDLREGLQRYHDLLLLGPPGGGKTTSLWCLALNLAEDGLTSDASTETPIPVFVRLGGIRTGETLLDLLRRELAHATLYDENQRSLQLPAHRRLAALLPALLAEGRVVLLWDGLNETPHELFVTTAAAIAQFREQYPPTLLARNRSVTTCRAEDFALIDGEDGDANPLPLQQTTLLGLNAATTEALVLGRLGAEQGRQLLTALA